MFLYHECRGQGYPILCLHGHPGSSEAMSVFTDDLANQFQTLTPDLRGYGRSKVNTPFVMEDHLSDLDVLLDYYEITECLILGWSLGGILAIEMALRFPSRVKGVILIGTAAHPQGSHPPISLADNLLTGLASVLNWLNPSWRWNIETLGKRSLFRYLVQQHTAEVYRRLGTEGISAYFQTTKHATQALYSAMSQGYNRIPDLQYIQCPCLVLAGECDRHITSASSRETAEHLPNAIYQEYEQVAHLFPWEIPSQVLLDIRNWMNITFP